MMTGGFVAAGGTVVLKVRSIAMFPTVAHRFSAEKALGNQWWARRAVPRVLRTIVP